MILATTFVHSLAHAQTGVSDDRVSLPAGPGSLEGVGDDVALDPNMGSMTYSVDIQLPSGFRGATPSLSLNYSSAAGSSALGIGWSMSVPAIGRMTSRGAPNYTTDDLFDVDGSELVQVGSDAGDLIYRARFEGGFVRYRWVAAGTGTDGHWIAESPDGGRSYFGADAQGNLVPSARRMRPQGGTAEYCLVESVDVYGHAVRYSYTQPEGSVPLLSGISWLDDGTGNDIYSVSVGYEDRPDLLSDASRGYEELLADRVKRVQVRNSSNIIREYVLTYQDDEAAGGFSRLATVERYGRGGQAAGPRYPVVFSFDYSRALGVECSGLDCDRPYMTTIAGAVDGLSFGTGRATLIDINGDGLPDVLNTADTTNGHRFQINTLTPRADGGFDQSFTSATTSGVTGTNSFLIGGTSRIQVFDVNGDGRTDLLNAGNGAWLENGGDGDWAA
ncbi:MAG: SpvB/TcaC N-terminal domain-containing protein, partial [Planctomycetota bacterium]